MSWLPILEVMMMTVFLKFTVLSVRDFVTLHADELGGRRS
jgi:hypothetical protein